mgnify:CR=1 FL=1
MSRRTQDVLELSNGLRIFPGMETDVAEGGHILSIGPLEAILELNRRLEPYKEKRKFLPFAQLMDLFEEYPVLVAAATPTAPRAMCRSFRRSSCAACSFWISTERIWRWTAPAPRS